MGPVPNLRRYPARRRAGCFGPASAAPESPSLFARAVAGVIDAVQQAPFTGGPAKDWSDVKRLLRDSGDQGLITVAKNLD